MSCPEEVKDSHPLNTTFTKDTGGFTGHLAQKGFSLRKYR